MAFQLALPRITALEQGSGELPKGPWVLMLKAWKSKPRSLDFTPRANRSLGA